MWRNTVPFSSRVTEKLTKKLAEILQVTQSEFPTY